MLLASLPLLFSCTGENADSGAQGYLTASIEQDFTVDVVKAGTKADDAEDQAFKLEIYKSGSLVSEVADHRTLSDTPLTLNIGTYSITASNRDETAAIFDSPRYAGTGSVKVVKDVVTTASITCTLSDVLAVPSFSDDFSTMFQSYSLDITNGEGSLTWSEADGTLDKTGYFRNTGTLTWTLTAVNQAGRTVTATDTYDTEARQKYLLSFKIEEDGGGAAGPVKIVLDDTTTERSYDLELDLSTKKAIINGANAWAMFADVSGTWSFSEQPETITILYRKASDTDWTEYTGTTDIDASARSFSAQITGLEPETAYEVKVETSSDIKASDPYAFTTEAAGTLHNMSFDSWYTDGKAPMPNADSDHYVWDSANKGTASLGTIPTTQETSHLAVTGDSKSAAKLVSSKAFGILAAGNIYTGNFVKVSGLGAELNWGTPFTSRPLALKGYLDYTPVNIDMTKDPYTSLEGQPDTCKIQVFLTENTEQYVINTSSQQFVDINGSDIIAYGTIETGTATSTKSELTNGYEQFTIKLDYRDTTKKPNMIVIVAGASKYGDYFTGGVGSTLYLDEFEFVYDPTEL